MQPGLTTAPCGVCIGSLQIAYLWKWHFLPKEMVWMCLTVPHPPTHSLPTHGNWSRGRLAFWTHGPAVRVRGKERLLWLWFMKPETMPWERLKCSKSKRAFTQEGWPKMRWGGVGDTWGGVGHDSEPKPTGRFENPRNLMEGAVGMGNSKCPAWILPS